MELHLYKPGSGSLGALVESFVEERKAMAFVLGDNAIYLIKLPEDGTFSFLDMLNHEHLHLALFRIGEGKAALVLDSVSYGNRWRENGGSIGGL